MKLLFKKFIHLWLFKNKISKIKIAHFSHRLPETQLVDRLHAERFYTDSRIPLSPGSIHSGHSVILAPGHRPGSGMRVDLGNHMVGTDSIHTILRPEGSRVLCSAPKTSYYYGWQEDGVGLTQPTRDVRPPAVQLSPLLEVTARKYCFWAIIV